MFPSAQAKSKIIVRHGADQTHYIHHSASPWIAWVDLGNTRDARLDTTLPSGVDMGNEVRELPSVENPLDLGGPLGSTICTRPQIGPRPRMFLVVGTQNAGPFLEIAQGLRAAIECEVECSL